MDATFHLSFFRRAAFSLLLVAMLAAFGSAAVHTADESKQAITTVHTFS